LEFVQEAYKHCKTIAASGAGADLIRACGFANGSEKPQAKEPIDDEGLIVSGNNQVGKIASQFIEAMAQHRHWSREKRLHPPD
jgi:catalase